jgi:hypothetical protein
MQKEIFKMIFMGTFRMPSDKKDEWMNCFAGIKENPPTEGIKKWQTFMCSDEFEYKGYNIIFTEKGKADEALVEISKTMLPFTQIEGASWTLEPLLSVTDTIKVLEK